MWISINHYENWFIKVCFLWFVKGTIFISFIWQYISRDSLFFLENGEKGFEHLLEDICSYTL